MRRNRRILSQDSPGANPAPREVIDIVLMEKLATGARALLALRDRENGQGLAEYALILALIAIVAIVALVFMGQQVGNELSVIGEAVASAAP